MPRAEVERFLKGFAGRENVSVWYSGLEGWKPARQFFDTAGSVSAPDIVEDASGPLDPNRRTNFIARHWRGDYPLGVSYWCNVVLGNFGGGVVAVILADLITSEAGYDPRVIFVYIAAVWLFTGALVVWQTVGVWRSANRYRVSRHALGKRAGWAMAARIAVTVGFLSSLGAFARAGWPQLREVSRMAFLDDPGIPPYSIRVMRSGTEAEITGGIKYGLTDDFRKILQASPGIKVVHLDSAGGRVGEAVKLYDLFRSQGVDAYVSSGCYSACTIAFAAGRRRILRSGAVLGFHAAAFPGMTKNDREDPSFGQRRVFTEAGFDRTFIDKALATPSSDMWEPSVEVLTAAHVITGLSAGADFAISGFGANLGRDQMAGMIVKNSPILQAIQSRFPADYEQIVSVYYDGYLSGRTDNEETTDASAGILAIIRKLRPMAGDAVLVDIGQLFADQYAALGARDPTACYQFASGNTTRVSFDGDLPASLLTREDALNRRIIETARPRDPDPDKVVADLWRKLGRQLAARGVSEDQLDLWNGSAVSAARYGEFCSVSVALYREIARLPQNEAAILMRSMLIDK